MGYIKIAGIRFEVDARVVLWDEGPRFDAHAHRCVGPGAPRCTTEGKKDGITPYGDKAKNTRANRYARRPALKSYGHEAGKIPLGAVQHVIRKFVLHHDGCPNAETCFKVLHNERGLSCHFLLDNDGTIYQTLDLSFMAFHAAGFNADSIGIEISNRGDAKKSPNYKPYRGRRETTTVKIHNHIYKCYKFTPEQHDAMRALAKGLSRALPNLPLEYPQDTPGHQAWSEISNAKRFAGYMGHYHTTRRKWDPGPFDFKEFCEKSRGSLCFPVFSRKAEAGARPEIPDDTDALVARTDELYQLNEGKSEGGYFPVGPNSSDGEARLWHGGVHLPGTFKAPVFAPFPGRLMVARMGSSTDVGSVNFVLLRHDMTIGTGSIRFFSLYFHLFNELDTDPGEPGAPEWLATAEWQQQKRNRTIVLLSEPIEAGRIIGRVGKGGPPAARAAQTHFEIFSGDEVTEKIEADKQFLTEHWEVVDGTVGGRFSRSSRINDLLDTSPRDGKISRAELLSFFRTSSDRNLTRNVAVLYPAEWTDTPSWFESLKLAPEFAALGDDRLRRLVEDQITPTLWWTDEVVRHAKLPKDGVVYHYHPLSFIKYINSKLLQAKALAADGIGQHDESKAEVTPEGVTDDLGDESGDSFVEAAELDSEAFDDSLGLEELVKGFPE